MITHCTGVKENDRVFGDLLDVFLSTVEVETTGLGIVVSVGFQIKSSVLHDRRMITPRWVRQINDFITGEKLGLKGRTFSL